MRERVLLPGETCWATAPAETLTWIVDAEEFFFRAKEAMLQARERIMLIGWDFDTRIKFEPRGRTLDGPNRLGAFLKWLPRQHTDLDIHLLKWNIGAFTALGRGMTPVFVLNWFSDPRLHLEMDGAHPVGAAHHQKIVVVDDSIAFCGGIDMTVDRWDDSSHRDRNRFRREPNGRRYGPWHDVTTVVTGEAAAGLGEQARARWAAATGTELPPCRPRATIVLDDLEPNLTDVDIAIARTLPEYREREAVGEIEALYLAIIAAAQGTLYLESQYLASRVLADAMAERLREEEGPEIVLVLPRNAEGWLESRAMDGARSRLLDLLWAADVHGRFGAYFPVTEGGEPIYVHAKVVVMDDVLVRVGSSNLNNRSLGFDTECDVAVEAAEAGDRVSEAAVALRTRLLAEHLGVDEDTFEAAHAETGSLLAAIEELRGSGRSLQRFEPRTVEDEDNPLAENELMDPERARYGLGRQIWKALSR